jgi:putative FmdB family regulatory protein
MPIYEYECQKCKAHTEIMQKITDKPLAKCRTCGGRLEKQWSQSGFQFKGAGWYVTDYAGKKASGEEEKKSAPSESNSEEKKSAPSESNSADKADTKSDKAATKEATGTKETPATKKASEKKSDSSRTTSGD